MFKFKSFLILSLFLCAFGNILKAQNSNRVNAGHFLGTGALEIISTSGIFYAKYEGGKIQISSYLHNNFNTFYTYNTEGTSDPISLKVLNDGSMAAYDHENSEVWSTGTGDFGPGSTFLKIEDNGNLVLYFEHSNGNIQPIWATGTCEGTVNGCGATGTR